MHDHPSDAKHCTDLNSAQQHLPEVFAAFLCLQVIQTSPIRRMRLNELYAQLFRLIAHLIHALFPVVSVQVCLMPRQRAKIAVKNTETRFITTPDRLQIAYFFSSTATIAEQRCHGAKPHIIFTSDRFYVACIVP